MNNLTNLLKIIRKFMVGYFSFPMIYMSASPKRFSGIVFYKLSKFTTFVNDSIMLGPAILIVLLIRVIKPVILIRTGPLFSRRIGHFALNTEIGLCRRDLERASSGKRSIDLFYCLYPICNRQLEKMWGRVINISFLVNYLDRVNANLPGGNENRLEEIFDNCRDVYNLLAGTRPHIYFTAKEENKGLKSLEKMGISKDAPFIGLYMRDSAYLSSFFKADFYYHNYRDSNIQNCLLAAEEMADRGYFVLRIGAKVLDELNSKSPKVIDYATKHRTDFLDIFLCSKCKFLIASPSGISAVPVLFRKPVAWANFVPLEYLHTWGTNDLIIFKKLWLRNQRHFMTISEIITSGAGRFWKTEQFDELGIEVIENSPEEIRDLAIEMDERLKGRWKQAEEDEELQKRFWGIFKKSELHGKILARIGAKFLRENRALLNK